MQLTLWVLVHARNSDRLLDKLESIREAFVELFRQPRGRATFAALLRYISLVSDLPRDDLRQFVLRLGPPAEEVYMATIAEQYREEGRAEALAQLVLELLTEKFGPLDDATEARLRAASAEDLGRYAKRVLDAATLDEVLS